MVELSFVKEGSKYVAEFEAASDFNLHIERNDRGFLYVEQRTSPNGKYDSVQGADFAHSDGVIDIDFAAVIYPKFIKVVSEVQPAFAIVTFAE